MRIKSESESENGVSNHARVVRFARMRLENSTAWETESAMGFVLRSLRETGQVPRWGRGLHLALRIARLRTAQSYWWTVKDPRPFVEAAGMDPVTGKIVDYELFYAHQEAYNTKRQNRL